MSDAPLPRILIADDDPDIRSILRAHLADRACEVFEAQDGAIALETVLVETPDLVLLDVMMPELSGWEICRYIRAHESLEDTRVVMLTAIGHTVNDMASPLYGADAHLDKPFDLDELDQAIAAVLAQRGFSWPVDDAR